MNLIFELTQKLEEMVKGAFHELEEFWGSSYHASEKTGGISGLEIFMEVKFFSYCALCNLHVVNQ